MTINPGIFREYDIRGIAGTDIDEEVFELIGKAYGTYMKRVGASSISMGRDCRVTSPELSQAVARGINSTGINVLDIGMVATPMLYFSLYNLDVDGGVMITASHNPGEYNGIKLSSGKIPFLEGRSKRLERWQKKPNLNPAPEVQVKPI